MGGRTRSAPPPGDYARRAPPDERFTDYVGSVQSIVTSSANNDSGMFEPNLRDERFLPFEGAGAESRWELDLPNPDDYPAFDYATISDVILHIRYTARLGVNVDAVTAALDAVFEDATKSPLALIFSLRHDFPNEWAAFVNSTAQAPQFSDCYSQGLLSLFRARQADHDPRGRALRRIQHGEA